MEETQGKAPGEALELLEADSCGARDGIVRVSNRTVEPISLGAVLALHVSDGGLNRGAV
jgi:hypothetical protein